MATAEALDTVIWFMMGSKPDVDHDKNKYSLEELGNTAMQFAKWGISKLVINNGAAPAGRYQHA
jgi:hypothetical protein